MGDVNEKCVTDVTVTGVTVMHHTTLLLQWWHQNRLRYVFCFNPDFQVSSVPSTGQNPDEQELSMRRGKSWGCLGAQMLNM